MPREELMAYAPINIFLLEHVQILTNLLHSQFLLKGSYTKRGNVG